MTDLAKARQRKARVVREEIDGLYEIDPDGVVWSVLHNWRGYGRRQLAWHPDDDGYPCVRLQLLRGRLSIQVHRLVAMFHLPPRPTPAHEVRHLDGDKTRPAVSNLAWGTRAENATDRARHGRTARGCRNGFSKLTDEAVRRIRSDEAIPAAALAATYGVTREAIYYVRNRKTWRHV